MTNNPKRPKMAIMPKKKAHSEPHSIHLRLNDTERAALDADRKSMPGIPVKRGAYVKHAVMSFPRLRRLEELLLAASTDSPDIAELRATWGVQ